ncbi:MAG: DNA-3-methyladenine glycosylase 2 family protein [Acidimicrobiia bacterium]|nr:DNA-3-methyladenine glycosylase 2 family protein [Acidimicrobiia bacterium]
MAAQSLGRALNRIDKASLGIAAEELSAADQRLAMLLSRNGVPPLWSRPGGFPTLVKIILEQQVSLASAAKAFQNLEGALRQVSPAEFLTLDDSELRQIGFSRQKASYCRGLASGVLTGSIDLEGLEGLSDEVAREHLTAIRGVGPWTADVYLLFALLRPDVWPTGDRALVVSIGEQYGLTEPPDYETARTMAHKWRPWRSVAARILWHAYLLRRGRSLD